MRERQYAFLSNGIAQIETAKTVYSAAFHTAEEEALWKQSLKTFEVWKTQVGKVTAIMEALIKNSGAKEQKALFETFYADYDKVRPLSTTSSTTSTSRPARSMSRSLTMRTTPLVRVELP